jgi:hypothetical protein
MAIKARSSHCSNGHEYTPENTGARKDPKKADPVFRRCKQCRIEANERRRLQRVEALPVVA